MERYWNCYVEGTDGGRHYHHWTLESAIIEAKRLARLSQGRKVYVLEVVGFCEVPEPPVEWHQFESPSGVEDK